MSVEGLCQMSEMPKATGHCPVHTLWDDLKVTLAPQETWPVKHKTQGKLPEHHLPSCPLSLHSSGPALPDSVGYRSR